MVVAHNMMAMNAQRQFNIVGTNKKKSMEKLSSGYKINRAADDAAGLTISETMRRQIRGLNQGANNTQDGISLLQVADGALSEVQDMLHRVTELSIKSANGTNTDADRCAIQKEVEQIIHEINRISDSTEFNTRKLFNGIHEYNKIEGESYLSPDYADLLHVAQEGCYEYDTYYIAHIKSANRASEENIRLDDKLYNIGHTMSEIEQTCLMMPYNGITLDNTYYSLTKVNNRMMYTSNVDGQLHDLSEFGLVENGHIGGVNYSYTRTRSYYAIMDENNDGVDDTDSKWITHDKFLSEAKDALISKFDSEKAFSVPNVTHLDSYNNAYGETIEMFRIDKPKVIDGIEHVVKPLELWIQSGAEANDGMFLSIERMDATSLGIDRLDISTVDDSLKSIDKVSKASDKISEIRSALGAQQNRLEHTYKNVTNIAENTQAAESRIRDTDMAKEMVNLSIMNTLEQAGQSMMAQANQSNQGVLALIQ